MNTSASDSTRLYLHLLRRTTVWAIVTLLLVVLCYYAFDRQIAEYVRAHGINHLEVGGGDGHAGHNLIRWLTLPPPWVQSWAPLVMVLVMARRAAGPLTRWELALFLASVSVIVADEFRESIGEVCGRYWPDTWFNHNPSLLGTGAYGFSPFHWGHQAWGDDTGSFPSGHAARIAGFASVWWIAAPRWRVAILLVAAPMALSLVAMNYHFLSDVVAGTFIGATVGTYAAAMGGLIPAPLCETELRPASLAA